MKRMIACVVTIAAYGLCALAVQGMAAGHNAAGQKTELVAQTGHSTSVFSVAFSPDGKLLASGGGDNTINLWDVARGVQVRSLRGHSARVLTVKFSPDSRLLASVGDDQTTRLWNVASGTQLRSFPCRTLALAFSQDSKVLVSGSAGDTISLWDVASGAHLKSLKGLTDNVAMFALSPNGKLLASGREDLTVRLWDMTSGIQVGLLKDGAGSLAFSPDGKLLACGTTNAINLWDVESRKQIRSIKTSSSWVNVITFSPDGKLLANGSLENTITLWDVASGKQVKALGGETILDNILTVAFSPDGKWLASGSLDERVKIWEVASGNQIKSLDRYSSPDSSVAFSPDGKWLAVSGSGENSIKLWDVARDGYPRSLELPSSGKPVNVLIERMESLFSLLSAGARFHLSSALAFSRDGKLLARGRMFKNAIEIWDVANKVQLKSIETNSAGVNTLAFSPDGKRLAGSGYDKTIALWDVASGSLIRSLEEHSELVTSVAFSPDGKLLASGSYDDTVKLWDVASGKLLRSLEEHSSWVNAIAFSPDGKLLASGSGEDSIAILRSDDSSIKLWDVASGKLIRSLEGRDASVHSVAFSPNGRLLASGGQDRTIKLWDVASGKLLRSLEGHSDKITSVMFNSDGRWLASSSLDGTVKIWSPDATMPSASLISFNKEDWLVTTPDHLFDGSPTAWRQSIWRFNNNTFQSAPVEAFFSDFFYPGLLADILAGNRPRAKAKLEEKDIRQPQVKIWQADKRATALPEATTPTVSLQVEVAEAPADQPNRLPPGGAQDLRLFRNGSLVKVWRGDAFALDQQDGCRKLQSGRVVCTANVPVVAGENRFTAYAFNRDNVKSNDGELSIRGAESLKRDGTLYVLAIGINKYANPAYNLKYAVADARDFSSEMKTQQDKLNLYARTEIISLTDQEATKRNILLAFKCLADGDRVSLPGDAPPSLRRIQASQPEDAVVIYFAGHGTADKDRFYMIPHDLGIINRISALNRQALKTLQTRSISDVELESVLERVEAGPLLMVIDACNSGQALEAEEKRRGPMNSKGLAQLAYEKGMYILAAAQSYQAALESARWGHGYLTYVLVEEGLKTRAADTSPKDGQVTVREWLNYSGERVPQIQEENGASREVIPETSRPQRPRVFFRRETEARPFIVVRFGVK